MRKLTNKEVIERFKKVHGDEYDYSLVEYFEAHTNVKIICTKNGHGVFEQTPYKHFIGRGCPKCGNIKKGNSQRKSTEDFIKQANDVHPDKNYGYDKVDYKDGRESVIIVCPIHGDFSKTPKNHLKGQGCPICGELDGAEKRTYTNDEFVELSNQIHNNFYV